MLCSWRKNKKNCNKNSTPAVTKRSEDIEITSLDLSMRISTGKQKKYFITPEENAPNPVVHPLPENLTEDPTFSTDVSGSEDIDSSVASSSTKARMATNLDLKYTDLSDGNKMYVNFDTKTCNICESKFTSKLALQKHLKTVHIINLSKTRRKKCDIVASFTCSICKKSYTRKHDLEKHVKTKHPQKEIPKSKHENAKIIDQCRIQTAEGGLLYQCDVCSRTFKKSYGLTRHRTMHSNYKPHCCHLCGKGFRLSSSLIRHINEFHYDKRKFKCPVCEKLFKNKFTLDEHENVHKNVRPYVCDTCGKSFRQSASLYVHKKFHSDQFPFMCKICKKRFQWKQNYKQHSLVHTGYKPCLCKECGRSFKSKQDLGRHNKGHIPVFCGQCGASFRQVRHMKLHRCKHSLKIVDQKIEESVIGGQSDVIGVRRDVESEGVIIKNEEVFEKK